MIVWILGFLLLIAGLMSVKRAMNERSDSLLFPLLYFLYSRTRLGLLFHLRGLQKALQRFGSEGHSQVMEHNLGGDGSDLSVVVVPFSMDNYAYLVHHKGTTLVVDPGHAEPVLKQLRRRQWDATAILVTHKHWDHSAGIPELLAVFGNEIPVPVYCTVGELPEWASVPILLEGGSYICDTLQVDALVTPGHTSGHVVYRVSVAGRPGSSHVFTGDLLFLGGCGKFFEGSPEQSLNSLDSLLTFVDSSAHIWPGHEYAKKNLDFAAELEPNNSLVQNKMSFIYERRRDRLPTCPSFITEELGYNPFLRTADPAFVYRSLGFEFQPEDEDTTASTTDSAASADGFSVDSQENISEEALLLSANTRKNSDDKKTVRVVVPHPLRVKVLTHLRKMKDTRDAKEGLS